MRSYNPNELEAKWQKKWLESSIYKNYSRDKKFYALDMFPYPSGAGLHVGHPKGYIASDVVSRYKLLRGYSILHPMGWDAFGLPAENYAIKNKVHPKIAVEKNISVFKKQLEKFGFTYDWDREVSTTDPEYYKWTQWIFLKMFEKGLAYESNEPVNWCPNCKTVLANEDLDDGLCERCGAQVVQKKMRQWVLKMTAYADRLLYDLDSNELDWEDSIIEQQKNWIGRSEGTQFEIGIKNSLEKIEVYTTRVDTVFGMTYAVVAPEHPIIEKIKEKIENYSEVEEYLIQAQKKTELERTELQKEKTGVEIKGVKIINPFTGEDLPLFVADYVLGFYGTGAVMAVPAHDERDFEFAKKYNLPIKKSINPSKTYVVTIKRSLENVFYEECKKVAQVIEIGGLVRIYSEDVEKIFNLAKNHFIGNPWYIHSEGLTRKILFHTENEDRCFDWSDVDGNQDAFQYGLNIGIKEEQLDWKGAYDATTEDGIVINSGEYSGLTSLDAREKMTSWLEKEGLGRKKVNYKMRDWVFSRQRYWGEPIPIVHCEKCGVVAIPENQLPVLLPEVENYEPTGTGEGPLAAISEWVNTICPKCGGVGKRETNTMPQWAGSSWYYLRYIDPKNNEVLVDKDLEKKWMPVDLYVGGAEHATRHLLYARFWHKFLYDIGVVSTIEPFKKFTYVGLILAEDGRKMSKRWNNVINPDDVIGEFGADAMRLYEMFMGPFTQAISWSTDGVKGVRRFLDRVWRLQENLIEVEEKNTENLLHKTIKKVTEDIENFRFNTAISAMMILVNDAEKNGITHTSYESLLRILSPFAPHIVEEIWEKFGHKDSIFLSTWPEYDAELIKDDKINLIVQINGKIRDTISVDANISEEDAKKIAMESERARIYITDRKIKRIVFVAGKLVNIVI